MRTMTQTCRYCAGLGWVLGNCYDNHGAKRHAEPPRIICEYCDGAGQCEDGNKLLAAVPPTDDGPVNHGCPSWA